MQSIMITPGTFFDGYVSIEYGDPLSAEKILRIDIAEVLYAENSNILNGKAEQRISEERLNLIKELKQKAVSQNYNAIIGYRSDCMSFAQSVTIKPQMLREYFAILVTVYGTPVRIEKEK